MARSTITQTSSSTSSHSETNSTSKSQSATQSQSTTSKFLDEALRDKILAGLLGYMTDEEISAYAENLLRPTFNAEIEASQQQYEATELAKQHEIENIAAALTRSIEEQQTAYGKNAAALQTAAQARGMGRSSYLLDTQANLGASLAKVVENLTTDSQRQQGQIQAQITQAAQQNAQTQGRVKTDYASRLAAKVQELKQQQRQEYNQNYLTAVSGSMGTTSTGSQQTQGSSKSHSVTDSTSTTESTSITKSLGGGGSQSTYGQ